MMSTPEAALPSVDILYQDNALLMVNKPANILSVPGKGEQGQYCVSNAILRQFSDAKVVHRLDMATSGVMVFAIGKENQVKLNKQFEVRQVEKIYDAVVKGHLSATLGEVCIPLMSDWPNRPKQKVCYRQGKKANTRFRSISFGTSRLGEYSSDVNCDSSAISTADFIPTTRVELTPVTGRSHQLRMHMLAIGHPIIGDEFYACDEARMLSSRLLLHARSLTLTHPITGRRMTGVAPTPF